jgi:hypothetical protein
MYGNGTPGRDYLPLLALLAIPGICLAQLLYDSYHALRASRRDADADAAFTAARTADAEADGGGDGGKEDGGGKQPDARQVVPATTTDVAVLEIEPSPA